MSVTTRTILFGAMATALLSGCNSGPDYTPIGDGLKAIGICLVVCAVVAALADLMKAEQNTSKPPETKPPRKRESSNRKENPS